MSEEPVPYLLGYRQAEQQRLERQAEELGAESARLFDEIGVGLGWRAVEIGCGPRGCLEILSRKVGDTGRVVGVERSADQAETAQRFAQSSGLANVEARCGDGRDTGLASDSFDLATARLVLVNVPRPEEIVREMVRVTKPGGAVACHEADSSAIRIDPPHAANDELLRLLARFAQLNGIDRGIAPRVPRLLREAGVTDLRIHPITHVYPPGHDRRMLLLDFVENARAGLVEQKLVGTLELEQLTRSLRSHLEDPNTLVTSSLFLQVWGRKPAR